MAHLAHYKAAGVAPMLAHYERRPELERGYERENIDPSRTAGNYAIGAGSPRELAEAVGARVAEAREATVRDSGRAMRKDANVLSDWVVTLPRDCPRDRAREFFECAVSFVRDRYGAENVPGGFVHMDEATPHVHIPVVPVKDGRIRAAKVFTRADLRGFHRGLQKAEDEALGIHVSVELAESEKGEKQLSHLSQDEYRAAKDELRRAKAEAERASGEADRIIEKAQIDAASIITKAHESAAFDVKRASKARSEAEKAQRAAECRREALEALEADVAEKAARSGELDAEISERSARVSGLDGEIAAKEGRSARLDADWEQAQQAHKARMEGLQREEAGAASEVAELERRVADAGRTAAAEPDLGVPAYLAGRVQRCVAANERVSRECGVAVDAKGKVRREGLPAGTRSRGRLEVVQEQQALDRAAGDVEGPARADVERLARQVAEQQRRAGELARQLGEAQQRVRALGSRREALAGRVRDLRERLGRLGELAAEWGVRIAVVRHRTRVGARRYRTYEVSAKARVRQQRRKAWQRLSPIEATDRSAGPRR